MNKKYNTIKRNLRKLKRNEKKDKKITTNFLCLAKDL